MKGKPVLYVMFFLLMLAGASALDLAEVEVGNATDTGFRRVDDLIFYRNGDYLTYADDTGVLKTVHYNGSCTSKEFFQRAVTEEDQYYDLWNLCGYTLEHLDYSAGTLTETNLTSLLNIYNEPLILAVTADFYAFVYKGAATNAAPMMTVYRVNDSYATTKATDTYYPILGHPQTTTSKWTSEPYYPYEDDYDNQFIVVSSYWNGATRQAYVNYVELDSIGDYHIRYTGQTNGIPEVGSLEPVINYFAYGEHNDPYNKATSWESTDYVYYHNGNTVASGRTPNNILLYKNYNLTNTVYNTITLPNGSTRQFTSFDYREGYNIVNYEDSTTGVYKGASTLIPTGVFSGSDTTIEYALLSDDAVYYWDSLGHWLLTGLPSPTQATDFEVYGQFTTSIPWGDDETWREEYNIIFLNELTGQVYYNPDIDELDAYGATEDDYAYVEMLKTETTRTEFKQTDIMVRAYDVTDDDVYVAYDCHYGENDLAVIDYDNYANYTDVGYSSACAGNKELYNVVDPDLESWYKTEDFYRSAGSTYNPYETYYVDYNTSDCIQSLVSDVETSAETSLTYAQDFLYGYGTGVEVQLQDLLGREIVSFRLMLDQNASYSDYVNLTINDYQYTSFSDMLYFTNPSTVSVSLYVQPSETSYTILIDGQYYKQGTVDNTYSPPIGSVQWTTQTPSTSYNGDQYLGLGSWILYKGNGKPVWNSGVTFEGYGYNETRKYYSFTCDYEGYEDDNQLLRVYVNDENTNDYSQYTDRWVLYDTNYVEYVKQLEDDGVLIDEDKETARRTNAKAFWCTATNICDDNARMVFALLITLFFTFGAAMLMYRKYENTLSARLLPVGVYVALFIYFASIGFFAEWYIVLNILFVLGALALVFNPSQRFGGGGGG